MASANPGFFQRRFKKLRSRFVSRRSNCIQPANCRENKRIGRVNHRTYAHRDWRLGANCEVEVGVRICPARPKADEQHRSLPNAGELILGCGQIRVFTPLFRSDEVC